MEVKPEHHVIDLGPLPNDWVIRPLGEVGRWYSGGTPSMKNPAYWMGDIPWVSPKDMKVSRLHDAADHISVKAVADGAKVLPSGTVLMVIRGMILAHSFPVARAERPLAFNQDMKALVVHEGIDSNFVLYWLIGHAQKLRGLTTESTHGTKRLPPETLYRVPFPLPPTRAEQEAIAGALSDADALIESLEHLVAKKRQIKHGAMQELLTGQKRLPGFTGEWETKRLGEIGEALIGLTYRPTDVREHGVLVLRSSNVFEGGLRFEDNVYVEMVIPEKIMVKPGDILICVRNGSRDLIGKCAKVDDRAIGMTFGAFMAVFRTPFHDFIYYHFQSDAMHRQIHEHLGATINQITNRSLNSFQVPIPPDEAEQQTIATILSDMDAEIAALEVKLAKARQVKQGMMQELLTGRIRLV